ncbi:19157_t:CDS:1 [Dentiscutata erythropus]|uniref:19157_t:CDS:1 n=1 Tax=Dentiscutata erythropus TaxID=1348616 RepID=A0A9N9I7N6_9GLOM|nr:19157_t:CDS:1 [Dentiscutata erythropus]
MSLNMNNSILNGKSIGEIVCNNPNKDFEILNDFSIGDSFESLDQPTMFSLSSVYSLNNIDNKVYDNLYNLQFDNMAIDVAKAYADSILQIIHEQYNEDDKN